MSERLDQAAHLVSPLISTWYKSTSPLGDTIGRIFDPTLADPQTDPEIRSVPACLNVEH